MGENRQMSGAERPYIGSCAFCGDGLLRFQRCLNCAEIVAMCDECELMWRDIPGLSEDANLSSDTSYPQCPACGARTSEYAHVTIEELEESELGEYAAGESL